VNDECHVALREVRHASNAARRVPALLPAQSSIGRAFRMQSRWALIPLIVGRRVRGGWRRMLRRAQSPIRRHARVQVLELARFYHAMPNTAEHALSHRAHKPKQGLPVIPDQKRKSPRNLAISWG